MPGADPSKVRFQYSGTQSVHVTEAGDLVIGLNGSWLVMKEPDIYQELNGRRVLRQGKFEVRQVKAARAVLTASDKASHTSAKMRTFICSFKVGAYDRTVPLVIEPVLATPHTW